MAAPSGAVERVTVVREREFRGPDAADVIEQLRAERFTGEIRIHMSQGAVGVVAVKETSKLPT